MSGSGSSTGVGGGGGTHQHARINSTLPAGSAKVTEAEAEATRRTQSNTVTSSNDADDINQPQLSYPLLSSDDSVTPNPPALRVSTDPPAPSASPIITTVLPQLDSPRRHTRSASSATMPPGGYGLAAPTATRRQTGAASPIPNPNSTSPALRPATPPSAAAASSSSAAANKRKAMVQQFIRSGESNIVFREKAPSIVPNETGVFYAPPSAMSAARLAAMERDRDERDAAISSANGFMPIPFAGFGSDSNGGRRSRDGSPMMINAGSVPSGNSSPRRYSALSSSPMGMSSRQLMFQLTQNGSGQPSKLRRGASFSGDSSGVSPFPPAPSLDRGLGRSDDESTPTSRQTRAASRFSLFRSGSPSNTNSNAVSPMPRSASGATRNDGSIRPSPRLGPSSSLNRRTGGGVRSVRSGGADGFGYRGDSSSVSALIAAEETRRRHEEQEANMLAPFLEARGDEDFVTYDLTRQQDYHKLRKEWTKERFHKWTLGYHKKRPHASDEDGTPPSADGGGDGDEPDSSDSNSDSDTDSDDGSDDGRNASCCRRCTRNLGTYFIVRMCVKAFVLGQSWFICGLIGGLTGLLAALVDLAVQWLIDLKSGYCSDALHLSNSFCCAGSPQWSGGSNSQPLLLACDQWVNWDQNSGIASTIGSALTPFLAGYIMYFALGVTMACLSCWLVIYIAPHAAGSGIPEIKTILGGVVVKKYLGAWTLVIKCIAVCLAVGSGLSIGKEGAFVHIACCVANILCRFFPEFKNNQYKKNEAITAAAASGISVAFGAPVGGVLFALEDISSYLPHKTMWRSFFAAVIGSLVLQSIDPYQEGRLVMFAINYNKPWYYYEMVPFAFIGAMGGLFGALFIKLNTKIASFRKETFVRSYPILEVGMVISVTLIVKYLSGYMRGNNNAVLASLFGDCQTAPFYDPLQMCDEDGAGETIGSLLFLCVMTFLFTAFSWSLRVPCGVWIPSLIIGASFGRVIGTAMRNWQSSSYAPSLFDGSEEFTPGIYALVGAASMLGGVTRLTVCLVVIIFELTGEVSYLLPIMVGLMFSKLVGDAFDRRSIFEAHLALNRYPFLNSKERISPKIRVSEAMSRDLLALPMHGHTVESLSDQLELLSELKITGFPIVTTLKDRFIVGYINRSELYTALSLALRHPEITPHTRCYFAMLSLRFPRNDPYVDLRPWLHPSPIQVVEHTPLHRVHDMFKRMGLRYALVTNFGKLVGIITKKDILAALEQTRQVEQQEKKKKNNNNNNKMKSNRSTHSPVSDMTSVNGDSITHAPTQFDYALMSE